jgi:hypothetical protein
MLQRRTIALLAALAVLAIAAQAAFAATKNGITPISPKKGSTQPVGKSPTFKAKAVLGDSSETVWLHVCKSPKKNSKGVICHKAVIAQMKKKGGSFQIKPKFFDFDAFWANNAGTYYWQAHRIACENGNTSDCLQEGPVVKFKLG